MYFDDYNELNGNYIPYYNKKIRLEGDINFINNFNTWLNNISICDIEFNSRIDNLPNYIYNLIIEFCYNFNQQINNLPNNLLQLKLLSCYEFNKKVNLLPNIITNLVIDSNKFNNSLDRIKFINTTKIKLYFNNVFNKKVDNLPKTTRLFDLIVCSSFNQTIDNLPNNIDNIIIVCISFNQKIDNLPTNLKYFKLYSNVFKNKLNKLHNVVFNTNIDLNGMYLSSTIKTLTYDSNILISNLPSTIKTLTIQSEYKKQLDMLPEGIEKLYLHCNKFYK